MRNADRIGGVEMPELNDMPATVQSAIITTLRDLDGETLKCQNIISLCDIISEKYADDLEFFTVAKTIGGYYQSRYNMMKIINTMLDILEIPGEEVETFRRHNLLTSKAPPSETVLSTGMQIESR